MRFGGHETFAIREGWLHKGLRLLLEEPRLLDDEFVADHLGVGRNMAKSILYWLHATRLAEFNTGTHAHLWTHSPSELGRLVWSHDPYFNHIGTWWALHIELVRNKPHAYAWDWFFNSFASQRFDRTLCIDRLSRTLRLSQARIPTQKTLQREIAVLLHTYARVVPPPTGDPEDAQECPFADLRLLTLFADTGSYRLNDQPRRDIPFEVIAYSFSAAFPQFAGPETSAEGVTIREAITEPSGPGRVLGLSEASLFELLVEHEARRPGDLGLSALGGERLVRLRPKPPLFWLKAYYDALEQGAAIAS